MKVFITVFMKAHRHGGGMDSPTIRGLRIEWLALATTPASRPPAQAPPRGAGAGGSGSIDVHLLVAGQPEVERLARRAVEVGVPAPHDAERDVPAAGLVGGPPERRGGRLVQHI